MFKNKTNSEALRDANHPHQPVILSQHCEAWCSHSPNSLPVLLLLLVNLLLSTAYIIHIGKQVKTKITSQKISFYHGTLDNKNDLSIILMQIPFRDHLIKEQIKGGVLRRQRQEGFWDLWGFRFNSNSRTTKRDPVY